MDFGVIVPRAYVMSRSASPGLVQTAIAAFSITPLSCVMISDMKDISLAMQFDSLILRTDSECESMELAMDSFCETNMPSLIIGETPGIKAIHGDGSVEDLPWQAQNLLLN